MNGTGPDLTQLIFPAIIALVMVGIAVSILVPRLRSAVDALKPLPVASWDGDYVELRLNGQWVSTMSAFRRRVMCGLRAEKAGRKRGPAVVANLRVDLRAWLFWARRFDVELRFANRNLRMSGGGFLDWPWTLVPRIEKLAIFDGEEPIGTFELTDTAIIGRALDGTELTRWATERRLGSMLPGTDEPVYGGLSYRGRHVADVRVPRWRTQSRNWLDFEHVPFVRSVDIGDDPAAEAWLLAHLALSAQAALHLFARSPNRPRPLNG